MPRDLPKGVHKSGNGWAAQCSVDGVEEWGTVRYTIEEAKDDHAEMKVRQNDAKRARKEAKDQANKDHREEHAEYLAHNMKKYGGNSAKDKLARDIVKSVLQNNKEHGVADGVEFSADLHMYDKKHDCGFDSSRDPELDAATPTLALELKLTQRLQPHRGSMDNPRVEFANIHYAGKDAMLVVMMYIPKGPNGEDEIAKGVFWYEIAKKFAPANGEKWYSLKNAGHKNRWLSLDKLAETLVKEFQRYDTLGIELPAYGTRSREFASETHATGQKAIDCIEDQVLRKLGARFMPPKDGLEGGPGDRVLVHPDGAEQVVQIKAVHRVRGQAGFKVDMSRHNGSTRESDESVKEHRPYAVSDKVDLFLLALLDQGGLAEYWSAGVADLLGDGDLERIITDANGKKGVEGMQVHPKLEDKVRLGDLVQNGAQDDMAVRTRQWIQALGPIEPAEAALVRKNAAIQEWRTLRLSEKAEVAVKAAEHAAEVAVQPVHITNNITINNINNNNINLTEPNKRARITDFFSKA